MAAAVTRIYRTSPFTTALTRCRLGKKRRLVIAVTCVPIPPFFLALPLRQMWLPLIGPFPVNSQILAINVLKKNGEHSGLASGCKWFLGVFESFQSVR